MAARRLIIVLVVLFVASIVAAALAPERRSSLSGDETTATTTAGTLDETTTTDDGPASTTIEQGPVNLRLTASSADPPTGEVQVGDQVQLLVRSDEFVQLEIPAFGVTDNAQPDDPARFSLLLRDPGEIPILAARTGRTMANLKVEEQGSANQIPETDEERPEPDSTDSGR